MGKVEIKAMENQKRLFCPTGSWRRTGNEYFTVICKSESEFRFESGFNAFWARFRFRIKMGWVRIQIQGRSGESGFGFAQIRTSLELSHLGLQKDLLLRHYVDQCGK